MPYSRLTAQQKTEYYGVAPWKAMNYAILKYNTSDVGSAYPCNAHFVNNSTGYRHVYPTLTSGAPDSEYSKWDVTKQNN
ncbi:MAG: hypothetical protein ACI4T9_13025 [Prevotella sp.]